MFGVESGYSSNRPEVGAMAVAKKRPVATKKVTKEREFFSNRNTWKQISTNVPPAMLQALKERVSSEYTMSHLLRDMIAESEVMRGGYPQPKWSMELSRELAGLRAEIAELRAAQVVQEKEEPEELVCETAETREEPAQEILAEWPIVPAVAMVPQETPAREQSVVPQVVSPKEAEELPKKIKPFGFLKNLPKKLGFGQRSA